MVSKFKGLEVWFVALGILEIIGGIIGSFVFGPGTPGDGYEWKLVAYTTSLIWFFAGLIFGLLFIAVAAGLRYLRTSAENSSEIKDFLRYQLVEALREVTGRDAKTTAVVQSDPATQVVTSEAELVGEEELLKQAKEIRRIYGKSAYENFVNEHMLRG